MRLIKSIVVIGLLLGIFCDQVIAKENSNLVKYAVVNVNMIGTKTFANGFASHAFDSVMLINVELDDSRQAQRFLKILKNPETGLIAIGENAEISEGFHRNIIRATIINNKLTIGIVHAGFALSVARKDVLLSDRDDVLRMILEDKKGLKN